MDNSDKHLCKTCKYRGRSHNNLGIYKNNCDYILLQCHSRGCAVEKCDKYKKGKRMRAKVQQFIFEPTYYDENM